MGLTTLTERRERGDAIETFKVLNGFNKVDKEQWFNMEEEDARPTRRNTRIEEGKEHRRENVLKEEAAKLEVRRNFFVVRAAKTWNAIPDEVKEKKSINAFKNAYDAWRKKTNERATALSGIETRS